MILKDARENYYFHTGKVSDIVRQLGLGAIALVWLFRTGSLSSTVIPEALVLPLKLVVAGLALDLLQYAFGAALWGLFQWRRERIGTAESEEFMAPRAINWPAIACFWLKVAAVVSAYFLILRFLAGTISAGG
ncbi:hypothetical protein [Pseudoxanthomonas suwonensis]|uniref:hypothetical protein n=1 Tax=Pseudoxanthomonas suwonensis TaxID=314722 RepID=UPI0012DE90FC|nr:hypothetical protein [Pseudoxanthomonas suwonensis]